jgi:DNA-binding response OmpR family regulator
MFRNTVLVVDDEPVIVETLVLILNKFDDFVAFGSTNIKEALTIVRGIQPHLVLLDVMMPDVHGIEHAIEMRDQCGCKVLMMSGQGAAGQFIEEAVRAGHAPFEILAKPIHPMELVEKIREMIREQAPTKWQNPLQFRLQ